MSKPIDLRKQYLKLAYEQLNPTANDLNSLQQVLVNWFCFKFNTTPNDPRLLGMRLDELLVLRMMHEINDKPAVLEEITVGSSQEDYEEWLKHEMGEGYKPMDQMVAEAEEQEREELDLAEALPDRIDTDFKSVQGG
jgi:hypothetical protein